MTDLIGVPAARENVIDAWKLMPNSAAPVPTRMSGDVALYGRISTLIPASSN
jgi:hypothetical protein